MSSRHFRPSRSLRIAILTAAASLGLAGCATNDGYYGRGYYDSGYAVGYGSPYYGWNDGFYYPGTGYYVYDRGGVRHSWNDRQRSYWEGRRDGRYQARDNWRGYRQGLSNEGRSAWRGQRQNWSNEQREAWRAQRQQNRESWSGNRGGSDGNRGSWWRGRNRQN